MAVKPPSSDPRRADPTRVLVAAAIPLLPPVLGWLVAKALSGPPNYVSWPLVIPILGVVVMPALAGLMARMLGSWRPALVPLGVAAAAAAGFGLWWGGFFDPIETLPGGIGEFCGTTVSRGIVAGLVFAVAIAAPAALTALVAQPSGSRRRAVLAVIVGVPASLLALWAVIAGLGLALGALGPPGCRALYLG